MTYLYKALLSLFIITLISCTPSPPTPETPLPSYLEQANALIAKQQYSAAIPILEEAATAYPQAVAPLIRLGQIYLNQQQWFLAEDAFNRVLARDSNNAIATSGLAEAIFNQGNTRRALELWQQAIAQNPATPGIFTGLGRTHLARLEFEMALQAFTQQETQHSSPENLWYLAALTAPTDVAVANDYLLAIPGDASADVLARRDYLLTTLVPFTAESPPVEVAKTTGIALAQVNLWPLAMYALSIAQQSSGELTDHEQAEMLAFLGHTSAQVGEPALDLFEQARQLDPQSALPAYFYGIYLRRQGAFRVAAEQFEQALELDPENAAIYIEFAQSRAEQGDFLAAEKLFNTATNVDDSEQVQLALVLFYANRGYNLVEGGIPAAESFLSDYKDSAEGYDLLGWMQFLSGDAALAQETLRKAITLDPELMSAHYRLARILTQDGRPVEAAEEYQHIIDRDRSGVFRARALKELNQLEIGD